MSLNHSANKDSCDFVVKYYVLNVVTVVFHSQKCILQIALNSFIKSEPDYYFQY